MNKKFFRLSNQTKHNDLIWTRSKKKKKDQQAIQQEKKWSIKLSTMFVFLSNKKK